MAPKTHNQMKHRITKTTDQKTVKQPQEEEEATDGLSQQQKLFGFNFKELTSWHSLVTLLNRPTDPAALGILRVLYGLLLVIDTWNERGLGRQAFQRWKPDNCFGPLFDFLKPLPVEWMYILYFIMLLASFGILLGLMYRWCLLVFTCFYWYIVLLDASYWNNHSYLFGLLAFLLLVTDGNRYCSIDSLIWKELKNQHVPLWNYTLMRFQVFVVYFLAGIKKLDPEWLYGYSERGLGQNWVFDVFRPFLTNDQIDLFIVHWIGFALDLSLGYLLFFDKTRPFGVFFGLSFHAMNSQIFSIGMFPYMGMATLTIFFYPNWPRKCFQKVLFWRKEPPLAMSPHCLYRKEEVKPENEKSNKQNETEANHRASMCARTKPGIYHIAGVIFTLLYISEQLFLPFSSHVFKGLDNWSGGLYGYTWNMMIYSHGLQIEIYIKDTETGEKTVMTKMVNTMVRNRWVSNPKMMKQVTRCIANKIESDGEFEITLDVWETVNHRVRQRLYDPDMDMLKAEWSLFSESSFLLPAIPGYWEMRLKKDEMLQNKPKNQTLDFIADFPGFTLTLLRNETETTINHTIEVLAGEIVLEDMNTTEKFRLGKGQSMLIPGKSKSHTVSDTPSYIMITKTHRNNLTKLQMYEKAIEAKENGEDPNGEQMKQFDQKDLYHLQSTLAAKKKTDSQPKYGPKWTYADFVMFIRKHLFNFKQGAYLIYGAVRSICGGPPFKTYLKELRMIA